MRLCVTQVPVIAGEALHASDLVEFLDFLSHHMDIPDCSLDKKENVDNLEIHKSLVSSSSSSSSPPSYLSTLISTTNDIKTTSPDNITTMYLPSAYTKTVAEKEEEEKSSYSAPLLWRLQRPPAVVRVLASRACRGAIKFGDELNPSVIEKLLSELAQTALPFQCAHGRPSMQPVLDVHNVHCYQSYSPSHTTKISPSLLQSSLSSSSSSSSLKSSHNGRGSNTPHTNKTQRLPLNWKKLKPNYANIMHN